MEGLDYREITRSFSATRKTSEHFWVQRVPERNMLACTSWIDSPTQRSNLHVFLFLCQQILHQWHTHPLKYSHMISTHRATLFPNHFSVLSRSAFGRAAHPSAPVWPARSHGELVLGHSFGVSEFDYFHAKNVNNGWRKKGQTQTLLPLFVYETFVLSDDSVLWFILRPCRTHVGIFKSAAFSYCGLAFRPYKQIVRSLQNRDF